MEACIALGLCIAWLGGGPALNHPRPQTAQPPTGVVVPAGHTEDVAWQSWHYPAFIPPAPLPAFYQEEQPQIQFEFSQFEACADSQLQPPAPPAELGAAVTVQLSDGKAYRLDSSEIHYDTACGAAPRFERLESQSPRNIAQLQHLRAACEHLEAAGMQDTAQGLRILHREVAIELRNEIEKELLAKETELQRLSEEIARLRADLIGDTADTNASPRVRLTDASELPAWEVVPRQEPESLPNPEAAPFQLIPSPTTNGRPTLLFPTAPMRGLEPPPAPAPDFELPPAPLPAEDTSEDPVA